MDGLFLDHYDRELAYLREMGSVFAGQYPKLAGRLGLDEFQCSDPFVERLLEGFAFMSARVQRRLDAEYPQFTRALFEAVFPHYACPIPSAGIFQLNPAHDEGSLVDGYRVPKGTRLIANTAHGQQTSCRFDTTDDVELWPLRVAQVEFLSRDAAATFSMPSTFHEAAIRSVMRVTLEATAAIPFHQLKLDKLRFHLRGGEIALQIYEMLQAHTHSMALAGGLRDRAIAVDDWRRFDTAKIQPVGFSAADALLPGDCRTFSGYRLLQEYFLLPEKFLFVDVSGLQTMLTNLEGNQLHLLFGFRQPSSKLLRRASSEHLTLHCVPAINLFRRRADRIHLDHTQHEHQLIGDRSRPLDFEIWSIDEMAAHATASNIETPCLPLYKPSSTHADQSKHSLYYAIERRPRVQSENTPSQRRSSYLGSEVFINLTDSQQSPSRHSFQQVSSTVYCTNRDLPWLVPEGGWRTAFKTDAAGPIANVLCLTGPTPPRPPLISDEGESAWRLVSHLAPNYLSLTDNDREGAAMLRELLQLYCHPENHSSIRQVEGLRHVKQQAVVRRIPVAGPLTFARGVEIEIECDEDAFEGGGAFLFCSILEQFFARYVTLNSFTETHLVSGKRGSIHRWPARMGTTPLL